MGEQQFVAFHLGSEEYGISILQVQEIKRITDITRVPYSPSYVKGVINLRGSVLPVIDLKKRLNLVGGDYTDDTRIIIVKLEDYSVGMIVDAVSEVLRLSVGQLETSTSFVSGLDAELIQGVGKIDGRLIILLNMENVVMIDTTAAKAV